MSALAPTLEAFFTDRLVNQRDASPHTIAAYRDTFRLLLAFAQQRTGKQPSPLDLDDLDAPLISAFLDHLEHEARNSPRTRNARLAAIHSLFRYAALRHPEHAALIARVSPSRPNASNARSSPTSPARDRRATRRAEPHPLDRPTRPRAADARDPDRAARLRTHRLRLPGRLTSAPARTSEHRQRTQTASDPADRQRPSPSCDAWLTRTRTAARPSHCSRPAAAGRLSRDAIALLLTKHAGTASPATAQA